MPKFTLEIDQPGDRGDLPWRVRLRRNGFSEVIEYRTAGTITDVKKGAKRILRRLSVEVPRVHLRI